MQNKKASLEKFVYGLCQPKIICILVTLGITRRRRQLGRNGRGWWQSPGGWRWVQSCVSFLLNAKLDQSWVFFWTLANDDKSGIGRRSRKSHDFNPPFYHIMDTPYMLSIVRELSSPPLYPRLVNVWNYTNSMGSPKPYSVSFKLYPQELLTQIEVWVQTHESTLVDAKINHSQVFFWNLTHNVTKMGLGEDSHKKDMVLMIDLHSLLPQHRWLHLKKKIFHSG